MDSKSDRNKAVYYTFRAGGITKVEVAKKFSITPTRAAQIIAKEERAERYRSAEVSGGMSVRTYIVLKNLASAAGQHNEPFTQMDALRFAYELSLATLFSAKNCGLKTVREIVGLIWEQRHLILTRE